ncbi:MAG: hypothetical protein VB093_14480 [Propionicimonas sp.]|nr:hypothetical protein [Propionicimonas sp.]
MDDFRPLGAPLEYWFVKVDAGDLAFLVDWILRPGPVAAEARVSLWVGGEGRVLHGPNTSWRAESTGITIGECVLTQLQTRGELADVRWELVYDRGPWLL